MGSFTERNELSKWICKETRFGGMETIFFNLGFSLCLKLDDEP